MHAVEVTLERIQVRGPDPAELRQPGVDLLKRLGLEPIETALRIHRGLHETGLAQDSQVLRHGWLRHPEPALDVSHRTFGRGQEAQDRAPVRLGNDGECGFHDLVYSIRRIYVSRHIYRDPAN